MMDVFLIVIRDAFWSAIAATGFAILFNVPPRLLIGCALMGAVGHSIRTLIMELDGGIVIGTFLAAITLGFLGIYLGRWLHAPPPVFTISGAIPMVPGVFAYSAMIGLINLTNGNPSSDILLETAVNAIKVALILGAIASGIILPKLILDPPKPVI